MVLSGTANIVLKDPKGNSQKVSSLRSGEVLGLSDLLRIIGVEYFGDIVVDPNGPPLEVMVIEKPDQVFGLDERNILHAALHDHSMNLKIMLETSHKFLQAHPLKVY